MSRGERLLMVSCGALAAVVLLCTAAVTGGLLVMSTGAASLLDTLEPETPAQQNVRFEAPVAEDEGVAPGEARPLSRERADALERARQELQAPPQLEALPLPSARSGVAADLPRLFDQVSPGVVAIEVQRSVRSFLAQGEGSGFVIDDRHIVTNNHVVDGVEDVEIIFFEDTRRPGTVVGKDVFSDLAVVRVDDMPAGVRPLPVVADFNALRVGEPVVAIGNPFGLESTMTAGIISALGRTIPDGMTQFRIPQTIQTDAAINPGNSGGPLINARGQVVGVNAQIRTQGTAANAGVGFAIPASIVDKVVPALIAEGQYQWPYLGVTGVALTEDLSRARSLDPDARGAYIHLVLEDGPAAGRLRGTTAGDRGLQESPSGPPQPDGDIVIAIEDTPIFSFDDLLTYISLETEPGATVDLTVLRGDEEIVVPLQLGARPLEVVTPRQQP